MIPENNLGSKSIIYIPVHYLQTSESILDDYSRYRITVVAENSLGDSPRVTTEVITRDVCEYHALRLYT